MKTSLFTLAVIWSFYASSAVAETPLERGAYLMRGIVACGNCHTAKGGPMAQHELAGGFQMKEETYEHNQYVIEDLLHGTKRC